DDVIGTGNTPVGGIIADVTRVGRAGGLVGVVDAAAGGSGAAGGNGVTAASIGGAELEAAEVATVGDGVIHPGVGDVVVDRAQTIGVGAHDIGAQQAPEQHVVLATKGDLAPVSLQADPGLATEQTAALARGAGAGVEA